MTGQTFDEPYWDAHWTAAQGTRTSVNPHVQRETGDLPPGTALDAGCGIGTESLWLAEHGWRVTGADISRSALAEADRRAQQSMTAERVAWTHVDLGSWEPRRQWDLVVTCYTHPSIPQLDFYRRLAEWVNPGGRLLVVGHLPSPGGGSAHAEQPAVTGDLITALLDPVSWRVETSRHVARNALTPHGDTVQLRDVVVRARKSPKRRNR